MIYRKPLIALTCSSNLLTEGGKSPRAIVSGLSYHRPIAAAGGVPVACPECCAGDFAEICDGLVLTGGVDIEPALYGEETLDDTVKCDPARTGYEFEILRAFADKGKPIFGICRGIQTLNVAFGGTLYQDLPAQKGLNHFGAALWHPVEAKPGSILHRLFGGRFIANSFHHQAIKDLAGGFTVTAECADDGVIEAFEHKELPVFAVQFHPERMIDPQKGGAAPGCTQPGSMPSGCTQLGSMPPGCTQHGRTPPDCAPLFKYFVDLCAGRQA